MAKSKSPPQRDSRSVQSRRDQNKQRRKANAADMLAPTTSIAAWIRQVLADHPDKSIQGMAEALGIATWTARRIVQGERTRIGITEFLRIQDYLGVSYITKSPVEPLPAPTPKGVIMVRVVGTVAAGHWRPADSIGQESTELVPMSGMPEFIDKPLYALRVDGTSVNKIIPDGSYAICVSYWDVREKIIEGDLVVIERCMEESVETSIRRVRRGKDGWLLTSESHDHRHQKSVAISERAGKGVGNENGGHVTVEIKGRVIWSCGPVPAL